MPLKIKLTGVKSNRSAIGARVTARYGGLVQAQEVLSQSSYLSAGDQRLHFGLGAARTADLEIRWPNGNTETWRASPRTGWSSSGKATESSGPRTSLLTRALANNVHQVAPVRLLRIHRPRLPHFRKQLVGPARIPRLHV